MRRLQGLVPFVLACILVILVVVTDQQALAANREWGYPIPGGYFVSQVAADDVGGVAVVISDGQSSLVVWLDSKGKKVYQSAGSSFALIRGVNNRALVFEIDNQHIVVVDTHGEEAILPNAAMQFENSSSNSLTDRNGFFALDSSNGIPGTLVRYRY